MTRKILLNRRNLLAAAMLAAATAAGAADAPQQQPPEVAVRERATQRWQALIAGKYEDAYKLLAPGTRAIQSFDAYRNSIGDAVAWTGAEVVRVECNDAADKCDAVVRVESKGIFPGMSRSKLQTLSTHIDETWIRQDGEWWLYQQP